MMRKQFTGAFKAKVVQELLKEEKTFSQISSDYEVHPTQLKNWRAIALEGLASLFEKRDNTATLKAAYEQQLSEIYALDWQVHDSDELAQKKVSTVSREQRLEWIEREGSEVPLTIQSQLLGISRSSLCYQPHELQFASGIRFAGELRCCDEVCDGTLHLATRVPLSTTK